MNGMPPAGQAAWSAAGVVSVGDALYIGGSAPQPPHRALGYLTKYDIHGNRLWTAAVDGFVSGIGADESGAYVAGFVPMFNYPGGGTYGILYKFDPAGNLAWIKQLSVLTYAADHNSNIGAVIANSGGVAIAGAGWLDDDENAIAGAFLRQYDTAGNVLWTQRLGAGVYPYTLAADCTGTYVAGATGAPLQTALTGRLDGFIRKYDTAGNVIWTIQSGAPDSAESIKALPYSVAMFMLRARVAQARTSKRLSASTTSPATCDGRFGRSLVLLSAPSP